MDRLKSHRLSKPLFGLPPPPTSSPHSGKLPGKLPPTRRPCAMATTELIRKHPLTFFRLIKIIFDAAHEEHRA
ncbi:hypothetical protein ACVWY5_000051 [Bradyrhizobium sp. USDA 3256]